MSEQLAPSTQNKRLEVEFFDQHARSGTEYNVFSESTNMGFVQSCIDRCHLKLGDTLLDLGCGSGVFSQRFAAKELKVTGIDISPQLIEIGHKLYPNVDLRVGDAENLDFPTGSLDAVFLGGIIHHFPDPEKMAVEVARVLKPKGSFFAFDPNRHNPFMYLYRDRSSPFYSSVGVTPNERPIIPKEAAQVFKKLGFDVQSDFMSVKYTYLASSRLRWALPIYNFVDTAMFWPGFLKSFRPFHLMWGSKKVS